MNEYVALIAKIEAIQQILIDSATGGSSDFDKYPGLRAELLANPLTSARMPEFVSNCRNLDQFWGFIKIEFGTYAERRHYIWGEFSEVIKHLEFGVQSPSDDIVQITLARFDTENIHALWTKALQRRYDDPEGAITLARTLLESVCKHVLDELSVPYNTNSKMNQLYAKVAEEIDLAPSQYEEKVFKQILGGCQTVIEGLASVRNVLSDSHGKGKNPVKPKPRHAELAVNLAGTMATFIISTFNERQQKAI